MKAKRKTKLYEWQQIKRGTCKKCFKFGTITVDHIIPVSILDMLDRTGQRKFEWVDNFEPLCITCNAFKANRIDITHPKTKGLLQELIDNI